MSNSKVLLQVGAVVVLVYVAGQMMAGSTPTTSRKQDKQDFARAYFIATLQQQEQQSQEPDWLGAVMTAAKMYFSGGTVA